MRLSLTLFAILLAGCSHVVDVNETVEYKCGEKIVLAEYLDDSSVILKIDGKNTVLTSSKTDEGERFDNVDSHMTLIKKDGNTHLSIEGKSYPMCLEIKR